MQPEIMSSSDEAQQDNAVGSSYATRRKSSKPIMEKKRRARINSSLNELKTMLMEALKKDSTRHSKLEKADILEMTVKYLKNVERQRLSVSLSIDPKVVDKYRAGFNECRNEVMKFLSTCEGVTVDVRTRLLNHLAACLHAMQSQSSPFEEPPLVMDTPTFQPTFLQNGTSSQGIHLEFPSSTGSTLPLSISSVSNDAYQPVIAPRSPAPTAVPAFNTPLSATSQVAQLRTAIGSSPAAMADGKRLASTINQFGGGGIAVFIPPAVATNSPVFLAPVATQRAHECETPSSCREVPPSTTNTDLNRHTKASTCQTVEKFANPPACANAVSISDFTQYDPGATSVSERTRCLASPCGARASASIAQNENDCSSEACNVLNSLDWGPYQQTNHGKSPSPVRSKQNKEFHADVVLTKRLLDYEHKGAGLGTSSSKRPRRFSSGYETQASSDQSFGEGVFLPRTFKNSNHDRNETSTSDHTLSLQRATTPVFVRESDSLVSYATSSASHSVVHSPQSSPIAGRTEPWRPWSKPKILRDV